MLDMNINEKVRFLREAFGLSNNDFAEQFSARFNTPKDIVLKYEIEGTVIDKNNIKNLNTFFGLEPSTLMDENIDLSKNEVISEELNPLAKPYAKDLLKGAKLPLYECNVNKHFIIYASIIFGLSLLFIASIVITAILYFNNIQASKIFPLFLGCCITEAVLLFVYFASIFPKIIRSSQRRGMIVGYASQTFVSLFPKAEFSEKKKILFNYNKLISAKEINKTIYYSDLVFVFNENDEEITVTIPKVNNPEIVLQIVDMSKRKYVYKHMR